jgi:hypothetical protein
MYSEPHFQVELILPNGFRGLVKAVVRIEDDAAWVPGQRCFRFEVAPAGDVLVKGPPLLRRVFPPDYRARFANGTAVPQQAGPWEIGLRPLKHEGEVEYFVVGTQDDYERLSLLERPSPVENRLPAGGRSGAKGGRRGRGGSAPSQEGTSGGS